MHIATPEVLLAVAKALLADCDALCVVLLDRHNRPIAAETIPYMTVAGSGGAGAALRLASSRNASAIVIGTFRASGNDPTPEELATATDIALHARLDHIEVRDHLVVTSDGRCTSTGTAHETSGGRVH